MEKIKELQGQRAKLVSDARKIIDTAENEKRSLSSEERAKYEAIIADVDVLKEQIDREQELRSIQSVVSAKPTVQTNVAKVDNADEYRAAFQKYARSGKGMLSQDEYRALNVGTGSAGGYLVPTVMNDQIVEKLAERNIMRQLGTIIFTENDKNIPVSNADGVATWTAENAAVTESDGSFSNVLLSTYKAATLVKVSEELLADSAFDLETFIVNEFVRRISALEESAFVAGDGSGKPTGVLAAGSVGVTAASASAVTSDEVLDLYYSLSSQYRRSAAWVVGTDTIKAIRKLKDSNGQYIWQPGLGAEPDTLLGRPVFESSAVPSFASSALVAAFGDMSYYYIAQRGRVLLQRLNELYAANGQVGFRGVQRVDGNLVNADAVKTLKMGA